ncbi:MAG: 4-hydroxy-tetrahydrodipicolinate synthase [Flavobacteriaceae bacterium]|nr:4-hydroxy-tetrahydrodipicolinate synthase [Flavobacteriaceae bacterium]
MKELIGTGVALVTPFTSDLKVDTESLARLVEFQIDNGIDYLVILGTTGESVTLTKEEKAMVLETVISANNGRLPLVIGIGGNNTAAVVDEIKSTNLNPFAAILSVSPAYNKPTQDGIYAHFAEIAKATDKPIILYNVPPRTSRNVEPETLFRLANDFKNIVAIKEAANDMVQAMRMIDGTPNDFLVISGDDMIALPMTLLGGSGVISVIGQGYPREFSEMIQLGLERKVEEANVLQYKLMPIIDLIFEEGNPAGIKTVLAELGYSSDLVRLPLVAASQDLRSRIKAFLW